MAAGMKDEEIEELKGMIKIKCPFDSGKIPRWLIHPSRPKHYPDVLIDYTNSIVVEVKATEIVPSSNVGVESTLRFPRIIRLRKDKGWQDVMTLSDVNEAKENGKVAIRRNDREQGEVKAPPAKKQRVATHRSFTLLSSQQGAGSIHEESKTNIFQGIMFYIMEGTHLLSKKELERLVMENGGTCVQNQRKARYIVASNADTVRVQILIRTGKYNIVLPQFVIDCIQEKDLIDISPKYMLFTTQETQKQLLNDFDMWGDSYTKTTSAKELSNLLSTIKSESTEDDQRKICQSISEIYFDGSLPGMIFIRVVAYIDLNNTSIEYPIHMTMPWVQQKKAYDELAIASSLLLSEGAVVVTRASNDVTHVILNANDLTRLSSLTQVFNRIPLPRFVTSKWVDACISNQCLISEHDYEPRVNTS
ncbi:hypothetical protein BDB01DRAFT_547497 [Pilobolus umbonatus]|nr:hypothetical protein BDB01DRAFT_547497 [Pilobolus umbonatus]